MTTCYYGIIIRLQQLSWKEISINPRTQTDGHIEKKNTCNIFVSECSLLNTLLLLLSFKLRWHHQISPVLQSEPATVWVRELQPSYPTPPSTVGPKDICLLHVLIHSCCHSLLCSVLNSVRFSAIDMSGVSPPSSVSRHLNRFIVIIIIIIKGDVWYQLFADLRYTDRTLNFRFGYQQIPIKAW